MKPFALFPQLNNLNKYVSLINTKPVCILSLLIPAIQVKPYLCFSRFASVCCKLRWPHIVQGVGRTFMEIINAEQLIIQCILDPLAAKLPESVTANWKSVTAIYEHSRRFCYNMHGKREKFYSEMDKTS